MATPSCEQSHGHDMGASVARGFLVKTWNNLAPTTAGSCPLVGNVTKLLRAGPGLILAGDRAGAVLSSWYSRAPALYTLQASTWDTLPVSHSTQRHFLSQIQTKAARPRAPFSLSGSCR